MRKEESQSFTNHTKFDPWYHFVLAPLSLIGFGAAVVHLFDEEFEFDSIVVLVLATCIMFLMMLVRTYALKLQDRSILSEERLRHLQLTGQGLDPRLKLEQVIALRFAADADFPELCKRAAETGMAPKAIKQSIGKWRADHYRV